MKKIDNHNEEKEIISASESDDDWINLFEFDKTIKVSAPKNLILKLSLV